MVRLGPYESGALILLSGYKYVHEFCPQEVKWILFQDDDTIITGRQNVINSSKNTF